MYDTQSESIAEGATSWRPRGWWRNVSSNQFTRCQHQHWLPSSIPSNFFRSLVQRRLKFFRLASSCFFDFGRRTCVGLIVSLHFAHSSEDVIGRVFGEIGRISEGITTACSGTLFGQTVRISSETFVQTAESFGGVASKESFEGIGSSSELIGRSVFSISLRSDSSYVAMFVRIGNSYVWHVRPITTSFFNASIYKILVGYSLMCATH